jgi:hypothetical protein
VGRWLGRGVGGVRGWLMVALEAVGLSLFVCRYVWWLSVVGMDCMEIGMKVKVKGKLKFVTP